MITTECVEINSQVAFILHMDVNIAYAMEMYNTGLFKQVNDKRRAKEQYLLIEASEKATDIFMKQFYDMNAVDYLPDDYGPWEYMKEFEETAVKQ